PSRGIKFFLKARPNTRGGTAGVVVQHKTCANLLSVQAQVNVKNCANILRRLCVHANTGNLTRQGKTPQPFHEEVQQQLYPQRRALIWGGDNLLCQTKPGSA